MVTISRDNKNDKIQNGNHRESHEIISSLPCLPRPSGLSETGGAWSDWWVSSSTHACTPAPLAHAQYILLHTTLCLTLFTRPVLTHWETYCIKHTYALPKHRTSSLTQSIPRFHSYMSQSIHPAVSHSAGCEILFRLGARVHFKPAQST